MGRQLPESWVEKDFRKLHENDNTLSANDYAAQEHFEKSLEVMVAALGVTGRLKTSHRGTVQTQPV